MIFGQRKKKALANKLYKTNCHPTKGCGLLRKVTFSQPSDFITQSKDIENLAKVCNRFNKSEKFWLRRLLWNRFLWNCYNQNSDPIEKKSGIRWSDLIKIVFEVPKTSLQLDNPAVISDLGQNIHAKLVKRIHSGLCAVSVIFLLRIISIIKIDQVCLDCNIKQQMRCSTIQLDPGIWEVCWQNFLTCFV